MDTEDETHGADVIQLCGAASQGRIASGEVDASGRWPVKKRWEASMRRWIYVPYMVVGHYLFH
jgi:hypothetical protein